MATSIGYTRREAFNLPMPNQLSSDKQFKIPEGKQLSDFVCWAGFQKTGQTETGTFKYIKGGTDEFERPLSNNFGTLYFPAFDPITGETDEFASFKLQFDVVSREEFNLYAIWDKYFWDVQGEEHASFEVCQAAPDVTANGEDPRTKDEFGFFTGVNADALNRSIGKYDASATSNPNNIIVPNFPVKCKVYVEEYHGLSSITLNDAPFAGTDVTEAYWNEHRNDLYKDIPDSLSSSYVWTNEINNRGEFANITLYLPSVTNSHVNNGIMNFGLKTYSLYGSISLFNSYDEAKTVMA